MELCECVKCGVLFLRFDKLREHWYINHARRNPDDKFGCSEYVLHNLDQEYRPISEPWKKS